MTFIITLIALVIERFFHWSHLRTWGWFNRYQQRLSTTRIARWNSYFILFLCILPFLVIVGLLDRFLGGWFYSILQIIFGVIILLYCLGPTNLWVDTFSCLSELHREDPKVAIDRAQAAFRITLPTDSQAYHQALTNAIFIEANQRIFAVVFWFVLLGPLGAVLYRLIALCAQQSELGLTQTASNIQRILDWLPVRILTFIFALSGHFTEVFSLWKRDAKKGTSLNDKLLTECGIAALGVSENNRLPEDGVTEKAALELLDRSFVIGLVILAAITLLIK